MRARSTLPECMTPRALNNADTKSQSNSVSTSTHKTTTSEERNTRGRYKDPLLQIHGRIQRLRTQRFQ